MARKKRSTRTPLVFTPDRLKFTADQPRAFAYANHADEFEVPPIPSRFALEQRQVSLACVFRAPPSSFDRADP